MRAVKMFVVLISLLAALIYARGTDPAKRSPIRLRLFIPNSRICASQPAVIRAEVEFHNSGRRTVVADLSRLGYLNAVALYSMEKNVSRAEAMVPAGKVVPEGPRLVSIPQGAKSWVPVQLSLDERFFAESGFYSIDVSYSTGVTGPDAQLVHSNSVIVEADVCSPESRQDHF